MKMRDKSELTYNYLLGLKGSPFRRVALVAPKALNFKAVSLIYRLAAFLYRVRVLGLSDKSTAETMPECLGTEYSKEKYSEVDQRFSRNCQGIYGLEGQGNMPSVGSYDNARPVKVNFFS